MADEQNAGGNPGAEGAAPAGDAAAAPAAGSAPSQGASAAPAGGDPAAPAPSAGDAAPKDDKAAAPADDKKADDKAADPIDYGKVLAEVKLPEGMTLDEGAAKVATDLFGKHGLTPDAVKELTDFYVSQQVAAAEQNVKAWQAVQEKWKTEANADSALTPEVKAEAKTVFGVLSKESQELLEGYGLTNFGPLLKDLARFHDFVGDDTFARGGASRANGDARSMFPNSNMNP